MRREYVGNESRLNIRVLPYLPRRIVSHHEKKVQDRDVRIVGRIQLRIAGIVIDHILQRNTLSREHGFVKIIPGGRTADVVGCFDALEYAQKAIRLCSWRLQSGRAYEFGFCYAQFGCNGDGEVDREVREEFVTIRVDGLQS